MSKQVVINTYKIGKYGRYIADVFYHDTSTDWQDVLAEGIHLNQLLLDRGMAEPYPED